MFRVLIWPILAFSLFFLAGCSSTPSWMSVPEIKPWVAPYERGILSREEMVRLRHGHPSAFREHVYAVRGAAQGATGSQGGGCGCN